MKKSKMTPAAKQSAIELAIAHMAEGGTLSSAAELAQVNLKSLSRWLKQVRAADGHIELAVQGKKVGRPAAFELNDLEIGIARFYRLTKESIPRAAYFFARDENVRPEIREAVLSVFERSLEQGRVEEYPTSMRRAFYVTAQERAEFRGKKASQAVEMITRRGMFEILEDGTHRKILAGDVWEMDDYSTNQPFYFRDPLTGEEILGRQILAARDLASASWLGFDHIGRERDAYRGEDIVRFIERLVRSHGKPRKLRLERGIWEKSGVHGIEVPGMTSRWGDLRDLFDIEHVFKSKSKGIIEGGFNVLQGWLGHTGTDIGRKRGEFEEATRRAMQAKQKGTSAADLGFLSQEQSSQAHEAAATLINERPMTREHLNERISPDDLVARDGWNVSELLEDEAWYFLPCKKEGIVRGGCVEINAGGGWPKVRIQINGVVDGLYLENGFKLLVACDPARPELGARICNAERGVKNRDGWPVGMLLIASARIQDLAPQFNASNILTPHMIARKKGSAAAATTFRSIKRAAGVPQGIGGKEATAFNGAGGAARRSDIERKEQHTEHTPSEPINNPIPPSVRGGGAIIATRSSRGLREGTSRADEIERLKKKLEEAQA